VYNDLCVFYAGVTELLNTTQMGFQTSIVI